MKVYGLGLPKTGTTTLIKALKILGFKDEDIIVGDYVYFLDRSKFNGKYILTIRKSPQVWWRSVHAWANRPDKQSRKLKAQRKRMYGHEMPVRGVFIRKYREHNYDMVKQFNPLKVCWEDGHGWERLCKYLDKPIPDVPFPHSNKQNYQ